MGVSVAEVAGNYAFVNHHLVEVFFMLLWGGIDLLFLLLGYYGFFLVLTWHRVSFGVSLDEVFVHMSHFFELWTYVIVQTSYRYEVFTLVAIIR